MSEPLPHFVSTKPFDPAVAETFTPAQERYYLASQWQLMWWKFRRHKLAVISAVILLVSYASVLVVEVLAPYELSTRQTSHLFAPPQSVHLFHEGRLVGPFVYPFDQKLNLTTLQREYTPNTAKPQPLRFFCLGDTYKFWGAIEGRLHLVCPPEGGTFFLLGTDRLGRDLLSRLVYGTRISLTVGLIGIAISFILGITIGGFAGYYGGWLDNVVQRTIEILKSLPELPLWMALSAALPVNWSPVVVYFGITVILGLLDWPGLARAVRSKLLVTCTPTC
jgi:peptide/nickel transport system permease protein